MKPMLDIVIAAKASRIVYYDYVLQNVETAY